MPKKQTPNAPKRDLNLQKEGNRYDKIMKENMEKMFRPLIEMRLGVKIGKAIALKEKMQTTIEREMDFFYEVLPESEKPFILHLEIESQNPLEAIYRIGEYHGMALQRKKMPIRHIVVYLGSDAPTMRTKLYPEEIYTGFDLIEMRTFDTTELLNSSVPEVVLMAILGNHPSEETENVLRIVFETLRKLVRHKKTLQKYVDQLLTISRLRKIDNLTLKVASEMSIHIDIEKDTLYLRGEEVGEVKQKLIFVHNLLVNTDFDDTKIAALANVSVEYVQKMRQEMNKHP